MFIRKRLINGQTYYVVEEAIRRKDKPHPVPQTVVSLGREKSLGRAYERELRAYLRAADKLARMERALAVMGPGAQYNAR